MIRPLLLATLAATFFATAAQASGDFGCSPAWKLAHPDLTGCDSMVMLSPGNDTRVNLALLLGQDEPAPTPDGTLPAVLFDWRTFSAQPIDYGTDTHAAGEGSRCRSDTTGTAAFAAAVAAARKLTPAERTALVTARQALKPDCTGPGAGAPAFAAADAAARSAPARSFITYLHGAAAFYAGDFDTASARFAALVRDKEPWLRETARYMLGRVEVNRAQVGLYDEWGYRDEKKPVDAKAIAAAQAALSDYLGAYPRGGYAASARGLLRRVYWLAGDRRKLAAAYAALLAQPPATRGIDAMTLVEEIDNKLLPTLTPADTSDPILLAVLDLSTMRRGDGTRDGGSTPSLIRAGLEAQRASFAHAPALFDVLLATHALYIDRNAAEALRLLPDRKSTGAIAFSRQMLRGMAMDATGAGDARDHWLAMLPAAKTPIQRTTIELSLALHEERHDGLDRIFAPGSPIRDARLRDLLLTNVAGADLLQRQAQASDASAHERAVALFTLLYKGLTRGGYGAFVSDVTMVPAGAEKTGYLDSDAIVSPPLGIFTDGPTTEAFACPALRETARRLAADPNAATPRLCLAEFVRLNNLDGYALDTPPPADQLGGTQSRFGGEPFSRLRVYQAVISAPASAAAERAYALFRAVRCYAPSGNNACGGDDVPLATRRAWFQRLHREYHTTRWAGDLPYYW